MSEIAKDEWLRLSSQVARYVALARSLTEQSDPAEYRLANELSAELFMSLPASVYKKLGYGLRGDIGALTEAMLELRGCVGADSGLSGDHIIVHAPGIGKKNAN